MASFNVDAESTIIDGNNTGNVVYVAADNVYVEGFTIRHSGGFLFSGFKVESSGFCNIRSDVFIDNYNAITLNDCSQCLIFNNTIGQTTVDGVAVVGSHDNTVGNNSITGCRNQGVELDLASYNNMIRSNIFMENAGGILIVDSHENTVSNNTIERNMIGVWLQHSYRNSIYQNQLSSNAIGLSINYADSTLNHVYHNNIVNNNQSQAETSESQRVTGGTMVIRRVATIGTTTTERTCTVAFTRTKLEVTVLETRPT
jgi:parallel beta-helix repeat protein